MQTQRLVDSLPCFNSIKVRLRLGASLLKQGCDPFQFHKGTIKTSTFRLMLIVL